VVSAQGGVAWAERGLSSSDRPPGPHTAGRNRASISPRLRSRVTMRRNAPRPTEGQTWRSLTTTSDDSGYARSADLKIVRRTSTCSSVRFSVEPGVRNTLGRDPACSRPVRAKLRRGNDPAPDFKVRPDFHRWWELTVLVRGVVGDSGRHSAQQLVVADQPGSLMRGRTNPRRRPSAGTGPRGERRKRKEKKGFMTSWCCREAALFKPSMT